VEGGGGEEDAGYASGGEDALAEDGVLVGVGGLLR
jgi:hypothetical protein